MEQISVRLTVYFDDPFWVGVYERTECGRLTVSRVVFGAEPTDGEVYGLFLEGWRDLRFSPPVTQGKAPRENANPKRMQRLAARELNSRGVGTKAQQAMSRQREEQKQVRSQNRRERLREEAERKYALRAEKRKARHRGH